MRHHLGEFEQLLMMSLGQLGPDASGLEMREFIERRTGRTISPGAIYTAMQRLEHRGFVTSTFGEPSPQRGGKRKKLYRLSADGVIALQNMRTALARMAKGLNPKLSSQ